MLQLYHFTRCTSRGSPEKNLEKHLSCLSSKASLGSSQVISEGGEEANVTTCRSAIMEQPQALFLGVAVVCRQ